MTPAWQRIRRQSWVAEAGLVMLTAVVTAPAAIRGTGFYMDDWYPLYGVHKGILRNRGLSRFVSRPGAWAVETVDYAVLRAHPFAWLAFLAVLNAAVAISIYWLLARFVSRRTAWAVSAVWILLPDHESLRMFPNTAAITVSLLLVVVALLLREQEHLLPSAVVLCMAISCYETAFPLGVLGLIVLYRWRARGTRRDLVLAVGMACVTLAFMSVDPIHNGFGYAHPGVAEPMFSGHFSGGLTPTPWIATLLPYLALAGLIAAGLRWRAGERQADSPAWLVAAGLLVIVIAMGTEIIRPPIGIPRGAVDRMFNLSSVGAAMFWCGAVRSLFRPRVVLAVATAASVLMLAQSNMVFQRDWSTVAHESDQAVRALDQRFHGHPPAGLVVGPAPLGQNGVRSLHDIYMTSATWVLLGHSFSVTICETQAQWEATPPSRRITWDELLHQPEP